MSEQAVTAQQVKHAIDVVAGSTAVATMFGWLPQIAAAFTIIWTGLRIYDWIEQRVRGRK